VEGYNIWALNAYNGHPLLAPSSRARRASLTFPSTLGQTLVLRLLFTMVSLLELPVEVIAEIASHLRPPDKGPFFRPWPNAVGLRNVPIDLRHLCCTCSLLRDVVQPMLFRSIQICYRNTGADSTFANLARTLSRRPALAAKVRNIVFSSWPSGQNDADEEGVWRARLPKIALPMLAELSNVTTLHFLGSRFIPAQSPSHLGKLLTGNVSVTGEPVLLPRLRALYISVPDGTEDCFVRISDYLPFFSHPALEQISIYSGALLNNIEHWSFEDPHQLQPGSFNISTLNLLGCFLDQKSAQILIKACGRLKSLSYSQLDNNTHRLDRALEVELDEDARIQSYAPLLPVLNPETFAAALGSCKDTLETLRFSFQGLDGDAMNKHFKFPELRNSTRLTTLTIEARHLRNFHDLPPRLKHLTILFGSTSGSPAQSLPLGLAEFVESVADLQPMPWCSLKSVLLEGSFDKNRWEKDAVLRQAIATGKWVRHGGCRDVCCLVWRSGDIDFTLRSKFLHWRSPWERWSRWTIMQE